MVRTDFTSDDVWQQICTEALQENEDGFRAYVQPVSDPTLEGAAWDVVQAAAPVSEEGPAVLFIVDAVTVATQDHPILVVGLAFDKAKPPFRCVPAKLSSVENNLNICNMDWEEFAAGADEDGVFRGFAA